MPVTKDQVLTTAALCRLDLSMASAHARAESSDERVARISSQLDAVLGYMDILNQVDTSTVEPLYSPMRHIAPPRTDAAEKRRCADDILANAPNRIGGFFAVPPVI